MFDVTFESVEAAWGIQVKIVDFNCKCDEFWTNRLNNLK